MSGHTPGPWHAFNENQIAPADSLPGDRTVAWVSKREGKEEEERANALLIAAAPELLEAANAMLDAFGANVWVGEEARALDLLMDAIIKVGGSAADA